MMKKIIAIFMAITMLFVLNACGEEGKKSDKVKIGVTQWTGCYAWYALDKLETINEHKRGAFVKMHKRQLSDHSQKGRLLPAI